MITSQTMGGNVMSVSAGVSAELIAVVVCLGGLSFVASLNHNVSPFVFCFFQGNNYQVKPTVYSNKWKSFHLLGCTVGCSSFNV